MICSILAFLTGFAVMYYLNSNNEEDESE